jgi:hypothetical protein
MWMLFRVVALCGLADGHQRIEEIIVSMMKFFWVLAPCRLAGECQRFGEKNVSIFRAEVAMLRSGGICIRLEETEAERVNHCCILKRLQS